MGANGYTLHASLDGRSYRFTSVGPKGKIQKRVEFREISAKFEGQSVFNLGFGDVLEDGSVDDTVASNNGDVVRTMATVLGAVYEFSSEYPEGWIFFHGSTDQRTTFYRAIIIRHLGTLAEDFEIFGVTLTANAMVVEAFHRNKEYNAFLVRRRLNDDVR